MDWKRFFDSLGMNGTRWQWRIIRWERSIKGLLSGQSPSQGALSVTRTIIFINLVLFSLMVLHGSILGLGASALLNPPTKLLIHWGGQLWPLVIYEGDWWRCLTYAFTHGGLIHIAFNMMVLHQVGPFVEAEIGPLRFTFLYTLTAITATCLGYLWHPMTPVVGASGSLFGLIGFAITYYHRQGRGGEEIRNHMLRWAFFAFIFGLIVGADNAGHLGGALGGAALGLVLPISIRGRQKTRFIFTLLGSMSALSIVGSLGALIFQILQA